MRDSPTPLHLCTLFALSVFSCMDLGVPAPCKTDSDCLEGNACAGGECIPGQRDSGSPKDDGGGRKDAGTPDAGVDAGYDAGSDAGVDARQDAGEDAEFDGGADTGADAGEDGGFDGGVDAGTDAGGYGTAVLDIQKGFAGRSEGGQYKLEVVGGFGIGPEMTGGGYNLKLEVFSR